MTTGNFNSQLGIRKWWKTYHEMATGNLTPFGHLKIYKPNGEGRDRGAPLAQAHLLVDWHCRAKSSKWGDPAWPSPFPPHLRFSVIAVSLSFSFGPLSLSLMCSFALSHLLTFSLSPIVFIYPVLQISWPLFLSFIWTHHPDFVGRARCHGNYYLHSYMTGQSYKSYW